MPAPIAIFAFNRPNHLRRTLEALAANELAAESHVTIFCDGPRTEEEKIKTDAVHALAHAAQGFAAVKVVERTQNMGCAAAVIDGLKQMFAHHEKLIVIEDDILTSPYTLRFLNDGLDFYENAGSTSKCNTRCLTVSVFQKGCIGGFEPQALSWPPV